MKGAKGGVFILLCIGVFIVGFIGSAVFKRTYKPAYMRQYSVEWSDEVGTVYTDIAYGNKESNKFDIYVPADASKESYGLVVYIHAGGFTTRDKSEDASVYSESMEIKKSIPVVVEEAEKLGYHLDSMAVLGGSAGGTLAMLYAYRDAKESPLPVKMMFEAVGPSSFYPEDWSVYGLDQSEEAAAGLFSIMAGTEITADMLGTEEYEETIKPISFWTCFAERYKVIWRIYGKSYGISGTIYASSVVKE